MLKPHDEVVNKLPDTIIIGHGWVGQHISKQFPLANWADEDGVIHGLPGDHWEFGFVCVPTPMNPDGSCDTSMVEDVILKYKDKVKYFCIKSTVEIGTTEKMCEKYGVKACFSPEYIGETTNHPYLGKDSEFIILGGDKEITSKFAELWTLVTNSTTRIYQTDAKTAELCKLMENSFIATKVSFVNEFFDLAENIGVDFNELRELWLADTRVSRYHSYCFRNNRGFGGKCLPKDLSNLASYYRKNGTPSEFIEFILDYNNKKRGVA